MQQQKFQFVPFKYGNPLTPCNWFYKQEFKLNAKTKKKKLNLYIFYWG